MISTQTTSFNYHGALAPLWSAAKTADSDIIFIADLMAPTATGIIRKLTILIRHFKLVVFAFKSRKSQHIFVREFSSVPLVFVFPLIMPLRKRFLFLVNHNLQWTLNSRVEYLAFRLLSKWGCRFVFFEEIPVKWLETCGIDHGSHSTLLHPVPETSFQRSRSEGLNTIGVIGEFRPEKGIDELLEQLESLAGQYGIVVALPNRDDFLQASHYHDANWFSLVDTVNYETYLKTIAECDVILLNHPPNGYEFRASGLIADAAAAHVPVVVRRLPTLCNQVMKPAPVGECFDQLSDIPACLKRVNSKLINGDYSFAAYNESRGIRELAQQLDRICNTR